MITKINEQEFKTKVVNDAVAVIDFSATWCGPCRMLAPVLEEISEELAGKANFYNVDVDDDGALA
ncbi:MAG: thioredoxin, partial [Clostridia bacterium]|nr:thioredoxin [Clostridia bacterium]